MVLVAWTMATSGRRSSKNPNTPTSAFEHQLQEEEMEDDDEENDN